MEDKIFTFHIHLPEKAKETGQPIVLGNIKELGSWESPIVKLQQFPLNPTYWRSGPVKISLSKSEKDVIKYKFAIHTLSNKTIFEGNSDEDSRILDTEKDNQFAIWKNNEIIAIVGDIQDYAFVDFIFNSINTNNLKDKIMEYQHL